MAELLVRRDAEPSTGRPPLVGWSDLVECTERTDLDAAHFRFCTSSEEFPVRPIMRKMV